MLMFALTRVPGVLPENFSAAYALAFCAGVYLPGRLAWWLPFCALLVSDVLLNLFYYRVAPANPYMLVNYAAYGVLIAMGRRCNPRASFWRLVGGGILGAAIFYVITNTVAWLQNPVYPKTIAGWLQALTTGIPGFPPSWSFLRNTLLSAGLFTALFVGAMKLTAAAESPADKEPQPAEENPPDAAPEESQA